MSDPANEMGLDNVFDIFTGERWSERHNRRFVRLAPEIDGLEMLYTNDRHPDKLFTLKILCWGLRDNGEVEALVPWLKKVTPCTEIDDPLHGSWQGFYDPGIEQVFFEAPDHKIAELHTAADYYQFECDSDEDIVQEIPDTIGTHAVFSDDSFSTITLAEVVSWQLKHSGRICATLINEDKVRATPVLPGDPCLMRADERGDFQYFFQHHIANKLKEKDPEAIAAISSLIRP